MKDCEAATAARAAVSRVDTAETRGIECCEWIEVVGREHSATEASRGCGANIWRGEGGQAPDGPRRESRCVPVAAVGQHARLATLRQQLCRRRGVPTTSRAGRREPGLSAMLTRSGPAHHGRDSRHLSYSIEDSNLPAVLKLQTEGPLFELLRRHGCLCGFLCSTAEMAVLFVPQKSISCS